jgi:AraC-like DNA-binding protein
MLNYSIVIMSIAAFSYTFLGRHFLTHQDELIYLGWSIFTAMLFVIGYMGIKQKPINPTFDLDNNSEASNQTMDVSAVAQRKILKILMVEFEHNKIYLNSQLNILDVVQIVGTNRTYISNLINQQYKQNFCTFVNKHRLDELERVYTANPEYTNDMLAECCGFGSANSMKRAVSSKTGMSMSEWKKIVIMGS